MTNSTSYTENDKKKIKKYLEKYPNAWHWTTLQGLRIPLKFIKDDHLKNIKKHIDNNPIIFGKDSSKTIIYKEWKKRFTSTLAGKVLFGGHKRSDRIT